MSIIHKFLFSVLVVVIVLGLIFLAIFLKDIVSWIRRSDEESQVMDISNGSRNNISNNQDAVDFEEIDLESLNRSRIDQNRSGIDQNRSGIDQIQRNYSKCPSYEEPPSYKEAVEDKSSVIK